MFPLPQATTCAVREGIIAANVNDGDAANDTTRMRKSSSLFRRKSAHSTHAERGTPPSTPGKRSSAETDGSTLVSSSVGSGSFMHLDDVEERKDKPRRKKSFFGLLSKPSRGALLNGASSISDKRSSTSSQPPSPRVAETERSSPSAAAHVLQLPPIRNRCASSPKTPSHRDLSTAPSFSSLMSTDSISTIATLSPHGRSNLRHVSTPEISRNPPIDPDFSFERFLESREPNSIDNGGTAVDAEFSVAESFSSTVSSPVCKPRKRKNLVATSGDHLHSPALPSAVLADTDPEQWAKAVEAVKMVVQKEKEVEEQQQEDPPHDRQSFEFNEFEQRFNARLSLRNEREDGYAAKLIHWCHEKGLNFRTDLPNDIERKELWAAIKRWEEKNAEADPHMESVRERFFSKLGLGGRKKSMPQLKLTPRLPLTPCLSSTNMSIRELDAATVASKASDEIIEEAVDRPLESSPDEEHYCPKGLGITTGSSISSEDRKTPELYEAFHDPSAHNISPPGASDPWKAKHPISLGSPVYGSPRMEDYVMSPVADAISKPANAPSVHESEWESVHSFESTSPSWSDHETEYPEEGSCTHDIHTPSAGAARFSVLSTLNVRRDSTRGRLTPKRDDSFHKDQWQRKIQEASERRAKKLGISDSPIVGHPALRLDTNVYSELQARRVSSLPPQLHTFDDDPTPTRKTGTIQPGGTTLLRKLQMARSPGVETVSRIPRPSPPKYGQHISPGKPLDDGGSPMQSVGTANLNKATPLPVPMPKRPSRALTDPPKPGTAALRIAQYDSPVDEAFDEVLSTWQAVTPQVPPESPVTPIFPTPSQRNTPHDIKIQKLRKQLNLPPLEPRSETDLPHPHHDFAWDTMNVMCHGVHRRNMSATSSTKTTSTISLDDSSDNSPLDRLSKRAQPLITPNTTRRVSSNGIVLQTRGKSCFQCGATCCYFAEQQKLTQFSSSRDRMAQKLAGTARQRCELMAKKFPEGIEEYDSHLACSECSRVFCFAHGSMCKDLLCRHALCADCDKQYEGRCFEHRE